MESVKKVTSVATRNINMADNTLFLKSPGVIDIKISLTSRYPPTNHNTSTRPGRILLEMIPARLLIEESRVKEMPLLPIVVAYK